MKTSVHRKPTSDAVEILNRTFSNSPERRQAIDKEVQALRQIHSQFTEQQIKDFVVRCTNGDIGPAYPDMLRKSLQIIKQLQEESSK